MTILNNRRQENEKYRAELEKFIELVTKCSLSGQDKITREIDRIVPIGPRTISQEVFNFLVDAQIIVDTGAKGFRMGRIRSYGTFAGHKDTRACQLLRERENGLIPDLDQARLYRISSAVLINLEHFLSYQGSAMPMLSCQVGSGGRKRLYYVNEIGEWSHNFDFIKDYIGE